MNFVHKIPVLRVLVSLIAGVLLHINFNSTDFHYYYFLPFLLLPVSIYFISKNYSHLYRWIPGSFISVSFILLGFYMAQLANLQTYPGYFKEQIKNCHDESVVLVQINETLIETEKTFRTFAKVKGIYCNDKLYNSNGSVLLYFEKTNRAGELKFGDLIYISTNFSEIELPSNPYQFDYKKYLYFRKVYHRAFVSADNWNSLSKNEANVFMAFVYNLRNKLLNQLAEKIENINERPVASALLLGYREEISHELRESYAASGAMHILAVSGLHVGIVFLILNTLLSFLNTIRYGMLIKSVLIISVLWLYAFLTGLSPSVSRAACMFSFVVIGLNIRRLTSVYNSICVSAFCLILYNPYIITYVGFQLSYAALLGIVFLQPKMYQIFRFRNKLADWAWSLTTVSVAAQITTAPLALLYFNQLPVYFILTNYIAIPAATFIISTGFSYLFLYSTGIEFLYSFAADVLNLILSILNFLIINIHKLPLSHIGGLYINGYQCILLYFSIIYISLALIRRSSGILINALILILFMSISMYYSWFGKVQGKMFVVHSVRQSTAISLIGSNEYILLSNEDSLLADFYSFNIRPLYIARGLNKRIKRLDYNSEYKNSLFVLQSGFGKFDDLRFIIVDGNWSALTYQNHIKTDYIILTNNTNVKIEELKNVFSFKKLIFDASNFRYKTSKWMLKCNELEIDCYNVSEKGAFIKTWK